MKIVINRCFGGFGLTHLAVLRYAEKKKMPLFWDDPSTPGGMVHYRATEDGGENESYFSVYGIPRDDIALVEVVEEMGEAANSWAAALCVVEVPDDVKWEIEEYDGNEHVAEKHRTWS